VKPERWHQLETLFHAAGEMSPAARSAYLQHVCPDDPGLAAEVLRLLEASERSAHFLEQLIERPPSGA
jgi:hypothetical protein